MIPWFALCFAEEIVEEIVAESLPLKGGQTVEIRQGRVWPGNGQVFKGRSNSFSEAVNRFLNDVGSFFGEC